MFRGFLFFLWAVLLVLPNQSLATERSEQIKHFEKGLRDIKMKAILPIIDVEYHHGGKIEVERLLERMNENGVALTWLGPNEKLGSEESLKQNEYHPDRFVPTSVHGDGPLWHGSDKNFLEKLARDMRSGKYFVMG
jgi:hypothetical protein